MPRSAKEQVYHHLEFQQIARLTYTTHYTHRVNVCHPFTRFSSTKNILQNVDNIEESRQKGEIKEWMDGVVP